MTAIKPIRYFLCIACKKIFGARTKNGEIISCIYCGHTDFPKGFISKQDWAGERTANNRKTVRRSLP